MTAAAKIPDVKGMAVAGLEKNVGIEAVLDHIGRAPFAGDEGVVAEMPPKIVMEILRAALDFPFAEDVEGFRIEDEDAAGAVTGGRTEGTDEDAGGAAVNGVRAAVASARGDGFRFDDFDDFGILGIGLGVDDVNAGRTNAGDDEVAALHVGMGIVGAEAGTAGVPAEVVEFIAFIGHIDLAHLLRVGGRGGIDVNDTNRVGLPSMSRIQQRDVGELFGWSFDSELGRWVERWIGSPEVHDV